VEEGAGIVVCQHSHRSGCLERHREGHIVYGQGNLVFDRHPHSEDSWYEGFLLIIDVTDRDTEIRLSPYRQFDSEPNVRRLDGRMCSSFLARIEERNRKVLDDDFLRQEWKRFCEAERDTYLGYLRGHSRWTRQLSKRLPVLRHVYSEPRCRLMRSVIQCESHREVLETLLGADRPAEAIQ
jgi:poly-gamma-glutamate synthesis protein (capsule biosynthesis protein)